MFHGRRLSTNLRRTLLATAISLAAHAAVASLVAVASWQSLELLPRLRVQLVSVDLVKDLPLGARPGPAQSPASARSLPKPARPRHQSMAHGGSREVKVAVLDGGVSWPPDAGGYGHAGDASADGGRRRPGDLRPNGPEGSRLVALLHLDRIRASPESDKIFAALDQLLMLLPDRRRLIDGSGFDLYRDFDSLLVATPDPADARVTFLAARHHLGDAGLQAGFDRAARAGHGSITWRTIDGRPVGIRHDVGNRADGAGQGWDQDDRILVLPSPDLALMATPAYAGQLLGVDPKRGPSSPVRWREIIDRITAEDEAMPEDAAFMMCATKLLGGAAPPAALVLPGTRGVQEDRPRATVESVAPELLTLLVGISPAYIQLIVEFKTDADAKAWQAEVPVWQRKLLANPLVLIGGFSALVSRAEVSCAESTLELRVEASGDEILRLLGLAANLTRALTK